jgi:hypothetical protein
VRIRSAVPVLTAHGQRARSRSRRRRVLQVSMMRHQRIETATTGGDSTRSLGHGNRTPCRAGSASVPARGMTGRLYQEAGPLERVEHGHEQADGRKPELHRAGRYGAFGEDVIEHQREREQVGRVFFVGPLADLRGLGTRWLHTRRPAGFRSSPACVGVIASSSQRRISWPARWKISQGCVQFSTVGPQGLATRLPPQLLMPACRPTQLPHDYRHSRTSFPCGVLKPCSWPHGTRGVAESRCFA